MFCTKCGVENKTGSKFCTSCGNPMTEMTAETAMPTMPTEDSTEQKPKKKKSKLLIPALGILLVAVVAVGMFFIFRDGTILAVSRSINNAVGEFNARLETSVLQAFPMTINTLEHGTLSMDFDRSNISLVSNARRGTYALRGDIIIDRTGLDFVVLVDTDKVAFGSSWLGRNYYGFSFDSFRDDFPFFARDLGLNRDEIDMISDMVEQMGEMLQRGNMTGEFDEYTPVIIEFMRNAEQDTERVELRVGGEMVSVNRIAYQITDREFFQLIWDLLDIFEEDEDIGAIFDSLPLDNAPPSPWDLPTQQSQSFHREFVHELQNEIRELERNLIGDATMAFYIGRNNRLMQVAFECDYNYYGEWFTLEATLNFGSSSTDTWRFDLTTRYGRESNSLAAIWEIRESGNRFENMLDLTFARESEFWGHSQNSNTFISDWNHSNGSFDLTYTERWDGGSWSEEIMRGNFSVDGDNFSLRFDDADIRISTSSDMYIPIMDDFINIDRWDHTFLGMIDELFWNLDDFFWGLGLGFAVDAPAAEAPPAAPPAAPAPAPEAPAPAAPDPPPPPPAETPLLAFPNDGGTLFISEPTVIFFTPFESGFWMFETRDNDGDPMLEVFNEFGVIIATDDDSAGNFNSFISIYLEAGQTYYIFARFFSDIGVGSYFVTAYR